MDSTEEKKESLFDSTMSLGDHLEELRSRLILALLGLVIGTFVCLLMGRRIIHLIERPYRNVIQSQSAEPEEEKIVGEPNDLMTAFFTHLIEKLATDPNAPAIDLNAVLFIEQAYVDTLKTRTTDPNVAVKTKAATGKGGSLDGSGLQTLAPSDGFVAYMKISLIAGLIVSCPWVFYQLWMFVAAGLYPKEKKYVHIAVPFSAALFIIGALFFLFVIAELALGFLIGFNTKFLGVKSYFTFQNYISFITLLMLVFGIAFQTPIAILILTKTGLVSIATLRKSRKYVVLGVFVVAAIATPPDVVSQVCLAIPLYFLFELGIAISWFVEKRKKKEESTPSEMDVY